MVAFPSPIDTPPAWHGADLATSASRLLLRIWLSTPFSCLLPDGHVVQWDDTRPWALRGGAVAGKHAITA
jgi:hypothetical protein